MSDLEQDRFLPARVAATYLGIHPGHLARLRGKPEGPPFSRLPGGQTRYRLSDLDAWMSGEGRSSPPPGSSPEASEVEAGAA